MTSINPLNSHHGLNGSYFIPLWTSCQVYFFFTLKFRILKMINYSYCTSHFDLLSKYNWICVSVCMCVCVCVCVCVFCVCLVISYLCDPMDCSRRGSSVHWNFHARILEWVFIFHSRGSSWPTNQTHISCASWQTESLPLHHLGNP